MNTIEVINSYLTGTNLKWYWACIHEWNFVFLLYKRKQPALYVDVCEAIRTLRADGTLTELAYQKPERWVDYIVVIHSIHFSCSDFSNVFRKHWEYQQGYRQEAVQTFVFSYCSHTLHFKRFNVVCLYYLVGFSGTVSEQLIHVLNMFSSKMTYTQWSPLCAYLFSVLIYL